jgi:hypothetical protein
MIGYVGTRGTEKINTKIPYLSDESVCMGTSVLIPKQIPTDVVLQREMHLMQMFICKYFYII